jgi:hypothetical protein
MAKVKTEDVDNIDREELKQKIESAPGKINLPPGMNVRVRVDSKQDMNALFPIVKRLYRELNKIADEEGYSFSFGGKVYDATIPRGSIYLHLYRRVE